MSGNETPSAIEQAMDWLLQLQAEPGNPDVVAGLDAWLERSQAHRDAFDRATRTWQLMGEVPARRDSRPQGGTVPPPRRSATRRRGAGLPGRAGGIVAALAAVAACLFLALAGPSLAIRWQADHLTGSGDRRDIQLADGTQVTLGAESAIAVEMGKAGRGVTLLAGEAFFDVTPDPARPFRVEADGVLVTVIGTRFDVRLSPSGTRIELEHGSVAVGHVGETAATLGTLVPGDSLDVERATGAAEKSRVAIADIGAWRSGQLFVQDATIASVVDVLRRYHGGWIGLPDAALGAQRVTGLYDLRDPDRALRALVEPYGGSVRSLSPYVSVLSRY